MQIRYTGMLISLIYLKEKERKRPQCEQYNIECEGALEFIYKIIKWIFLVTSNNMK